MSPPRPAAGATTWSPPAPGPRPAPLPSADRDRVIVVGAGVGGLAAAIELAAAGREVLVLEAGTAPGGKMRTIEVGGQHLDAGPTVLTRRAVFEALCDRAGASLSSSLPLQPLNLLARHAWPDGSRLDLHADAAATVDAIGRWGGAATARGYVGFAQRAAAIHRTLERSFMDAPRPNPGSLAARVLADQGARGLAALLGISPFQTLWSALGRHFSDPRLRQLFGRYATYCGSSPFQAPATLMLVAHVEQCGVWRVDGGLHGLARLLASLAQRCGARIAYGQVVRELCVAQGRVSGVRLADGRTLGAGAVVWNGDVAALASGAAGPAAQRALGPAWAPARPAPRSLSALTWHALATLQGDWTPGHHSVCFSDDYPAEFAALARGRLPTAPTVYVCAQDRHDDALPASHDTAAGERLMLLVNAPADGDRHVPRAEEIATCLEHTRQTLRRCGLQLRAEPSRLRATTPHDQAQRYPGTGGALYGTPTHGWRSSFSRPGATTRLPGLWLAGGSVHPGPGLPMAATSGRLAAAAVLADRDSTRRWWPAAMPGGTSTR